MLLPKAYVEVDQWQKGLDAAFEGPRGAGEAEAIYSRHTGAQPVADSGPSEADVRRYAAFLEDGEAR